MRLVVGLGNPGSDYRGTYHNIGFDALDILAARFCAPELAADKRSDSLLCDVRVGGDKLFFCKPQTYMNLSGDAVAALSRYYGIQTADILVIYDDIDIPKGTVRARLSGSAGTHNGMRDIVAKLGSDGFARVRVGTGFKPGYMALADYVLSRVPAGERELMARACAAAADLAEQWINRVEWTDLTVKVN